MIAIRPSFDQVHVVLVYLLIVLLASASTGRPLGFTLAVLGFVLIDYFFQPPYSDWTVGKPLDWAALVTFLVTALVATQLLARAQAEAEESRRRAIEVESFAKLGSETLSAGRAEDALRRIAGVIRATLGTSHCSIEPTAQNIQREWITAPDGRVERVVLPLTVQNRVVGVMRIGTDSPMQFDDAQRRFLEAIS